jgi:hypothetical protein
MERLVSEGLVYMNTLEYFAKLEADSVRGDENEGVGHLLQHHGVRIGVKEKVEDKWMPIGPLAGPIKFRNRDWIVPNVYCMYGLRASVASALVDPRNFTFGDTFVFFKEGDEFIRRAKQAALAAGHTLRCHMVEYINENVYNGPMGPFRKYSTFSYQSEVRFALTPGTGAPYPLQLGDLADIVALTGSLAEVNKHLKIFHDTDAEGVRA